MTQTYKVQVSMNQAHIVESGFVWKQGDFGFNIEIEVLDFDTTGATPQIIFRKSTGAVEATEISVAGNKFTYAIRGTELDTPGPCVCDLKLNDSTTKRVSTASFKYFVIPDTMDGLEQEASSYSDTIAQIVSGFENDVTNIQTELNQDVQVIKKNFSDSFNGVDGNIPIFFNQDKAYYTNGQTVDINNPTYNYTFECGYAACNPGDEFVVTLQGGSSPRAYAFLQSDGTIISKAADSAVLSDEIIIAPTNSAYIIVNNLKAHSGYAIKNRTTKLQITELYKLADTNDVVSDNIFKPINKEENGIAVTYELNGLTNITGTAIQNGFVNIGNIWLKAGTYYICVHASAIKPTIYLRKNGTSVGYLSSANLKSAAINITEEATYTIDLYVVAATTYGMRANLQIRQQDSNSYSQYHKEFKPDFSKPLGNKFWYAIGDSLTYGFIGFDEHGNQKRLEHPYPERVANDLLNLYGVSNKGETGTTIANDISKMGTYYPMSNDNRIAGYFASIGDIYSIMGMTNDYAKATTLGDFDSQDETTFTGGLGKLFRVIRNNAPDAFLFFMLPPCTNGFKTTNEAGNTFKDYRDRAIEMCELYGVPYLDMGVYGELAQHNYSHWCVDGTHFNQAYTDKIFAPMVADFIRTHYNR